MGVGMCLYAQLVQNMVQKCNYNQWLICIKKRSVGTPSAKGARIEAPQAPRGVGCGEGVSPSPPGRGLGRGLCPLPRKILKFSPENGEF